MKSAWIAERRLAEVLPFPGQPASHDWASRGHKGPSISEHSDGQYLFQSSPLHCLSWLGLHFSLISCSSKACPSFSKCWSLIKLLHPKLCLINCSQKTQAVGLPGSTQVQNIPHIAASGSFETSCRSCHFYTLSEFLMSLGKIYILTMANRAQKMCSPHLLQLWAHLLFAASPSASWASSLDTPTAIQTGSFAFGDASPEPSFSFFSSLL
jgi:hypothetical protein